MKKLTETQKNQIFYFFGVIAIVVVMAALATQIPALKSETSEKEQRTFYRGEILLPGYACPDTMIVENAAALNEIFDGADLPTPATDSEIDSVIHLYCFHVPKNVTKICDDGPDRISVQFWEDNQQYAFDYLTVEEFKQEFKIK